MPFSLYQAKLNSACSCTVRATDPSYLGQLEVNGIYELKRDALLVAYRGYMDSIENPDLTVEGLERNHDPYYTALRGVLPAGTRMRFINVYRHRSLFSSRSTYWYYGEILSGEFKKEQVGFLQACARLVIGGRPKTGRAVIGDLVGGTRFELHEFERNLAPSEGG